MKTLILVYCYYDESHNVLDTMEVFPYVDSIIIRKTYDFHHVNTLVNHQKSIVEGLLYLQLDCFSSYVLVIIDSLLY